MLFIVWDTVRADRLSLYGYGKPTTPFLVEWARQARVYDDCVSVASSTVPSHAAMFTGLMPTEHGANNSHLFLSDGFHTLAEQFQEGGYRTYLFSANPHISKELNFTQGFDVEEHPWDPKYAEEAYRILLKKLHPADRSSELPAKLRRSGRFKSWDIKAVGELAQRGLEDWLRTSAPDRPWFAFLNYMEAHRPFMPPHEVRARLMTPAQVQRSYEVDRSALPMWSYSFGLSEYTPEELEVMASTYDATLVELDDLFRNLVTSLAAAGRLDDTIVVLTSDHGEHLGEHHLLDHQFSLYQGVLQVPLVLYHPQLVRPGRESAPVSNVDIYATLPAMAGIPGTARSRRGHSLLEPAESRSRLAEFPSPFAFPIEMVRRGFPQFDPTPYQRQLRALFDGPYKLIWGSDGRHELYDLAATPDESRDILDQRSELTARLQARLQEKVEGMSPYRPDGQAREQLSEEMRERLNALGYLR